MANPTIQTLVDRARGVLNEKVANAWLDDDMVLLGFIATGLQELHARMKTRLQGALPPIASPYWRNFLKRTTLVTSAGDQEISLPTDFDILVSLVDGFTDEPLMPYDESEERIFRRGHVFGVNHNAAGYYTFAPGAKLRVLVYPGEEGVPPVATQLQMRYYSHMPRYTALVDTVIIPDEFTDAAVSFAVAKGYARFRDSPQEMFAIFNEHVSRIQ